MIKAKCNSRTCSLSLLVIVKVCLPVSSVLDGAATVGGVATLQQVAVLSVSEAALRRVHAVQPAALLRSPVILQMMLRIGPHCGDVVHLSALRQNKWFASTGIRP